MAGKIRESWSTRIGVILAAAGSAVGLGNFLRFPGQAAKYGGGAFMLAYFISFLLLGLPICWAEWTMGRRGGRHGCNSSPAILAAISRKPWAKYLGIIGFLIPVIIYMYYVYIEAWCLGYAVNFAAGKLHFENPGESGAFFHRFIGVSENGAALGLGFQQVGLYLIFVFVLNFVLIYRGLAKGIEWFCKFAMPTLVALAVIILIRVLTLGAPDPEKPGNNVSNGLGFMWNPNKVIGQKKVYWITERKAEGAGAVAALRSEFAGGSGRRVRVMEGGEQALLEKHVPEGVWTDTGDEYVGREVIAKAREAFAADPERRLRVKSIWEQLSRPQVWLAAAGQLFFSLSIGIGIILTYASYLRRRDDVVLSGLAATSANEFCEVVLGGLIALPAGVAFLGVAGISQMSSTFDLGFNVLPLVFSQMLWGRFFGFLFFFLLSLAAVTSTLSMLQPCIAFLEEALAVNRRQSVAILGFMTAMGCMFVVYFSQDVKALDTLDFWATFFIYIMATILIIFFGWIVGVEEGFRDARQGAAIRIPGIYKPVIKYLCPLYLLAVFGLWLAIEVFGISGEGDVSGYIKDLFHEPNPVAWMSIGLIFLAGIFAALSIAGSQLFRDLDQKTKEDSP